MKLYHHPLSPYAQKVLIALYEKDVKFSSEIVNMMDPVAKAAYAKVYPLAKVPLIIRDDGWLIPESSIIVEFLDQHAPKPRLIPEEPDKARQVRFLDRMMDLYCTESSATIFMNGLKPGDRRNPEAVTQAHSRLDVMYDFLAKRLEGKTWLFGESFTMADCAAAPALNYLQRMHPFTDRAPMVAYLARLTARPSFARVLAEARPHLEAFMRGHSVG
jgi:glutathione S-transferase